MRKSIQSSTTDDFSPLTHLSKRSKRDSEEEMELTSTTTTEHAQQKPTRSNRNASVRGRYFKESEYEAGGHRRLEFLKQQSVAPKPSFPTEQVSKDDPSQSPQKTQPLTLKALAKAVVRRGQEAEFAKFAKKYLGDPSPERKMTCAEQISISSGNGNTSASNSGCPSSNWSARRVTVNGNMKANSAPSSPAPCGRDYYEIFPNGGEMEVDKIGGGSFASKDDGQGSFAASLKKQSIQRMLFENSVNVKKISKKMDSQ